tara:strand:+ start:2119 stop:3462 length:1344 start_codon:yes stop_codon:yes gene_type:complete
MEKIKILIPNNCQEEVKYTFHCLMEQFLGLEIEYKTSKEDHFCIEGKNGKSLKIENFFFKTENPKNLYQKASIPQNVQKTSLELSGKTHPHVCLYGKPIIEITDSEYVLKSDLIGSSFFMLSRWEEMIYDAKLDRHQRFPLEASLAFKNNFYHRPIVNEYLELLRSLLEKIGYSQFKDHSYSATISYDIDMITKWKSIKSLFQSVYLNLRSLKFQRIIQDKWSFFSSKLRLSKDPFFSFDFIINSLKGKQIKAILYFKTDRTHSKFDKNFYNVRDPKIQSVFKKLRLENIGIGLHPSYNTYNNEEQMRREYEKLNSALPSGNLTELRQHYLRFSIPKTWEIMEAIGFKKDSSMVYSKEPGFRCGLCYSFPVFDLKSRRMLNLVESPLIFMETPFLENANEIFKKLDELSQIIKMYGGENIVLWHNNNLFYKKHRDTYRRVLEIINPG